MSLSAFTGVRGTNDWETDQRPKSWREQILFLYPNGSSPITAFLAQMDEENVDDPEFNWWTENVELARGAAVDSGAYNDAGTTAYVQATHTGAKGYSVYFKMSAADRKLFRVGHQVLFRNPAYLALDVVAKVTALDGTEYIVADLLEDDDASVNGLQGATEVFVIGSINEENAEMPGSIAFNPTKFANFTQIFRTPLQISRTAKQTRLRTRPGAYEKKKMQALERHGIEMEFAFLHGIATEEVGAEGLPERTTRGIVPFIKTYAPDQVMDGPTDYSGSTWASAGLDWWENSLEEIFRYGSQQKLMICGNGALLGLSRIMRDKGHIQIMPGQSFFGMNLSRWVTEFGELLIKTHPLWNPVASMRNNAVVLEPGNLKYRYIQDTVFNPDEDGNNQGGRRRDGQAEEYLTECGLEMHHPQTFAYLTNIGVDG